MYPFINPAEENPAGVTKFRLLSFTKIQLYVGIRICFIFLIEVQMLTVAVTESTKLLTMPTTVSVRVVLDYSDTGSHSR